MKKCKNITYERKKKNKTEKNSQAATERKRTRLVQRRLAQLHQCLITGYRKPALGGGGTFALGCLFIDYNAAGGSTG